LLFIIDSVWKLLDRRYEKVWEEKEENYSTRNKETK